MMAFPGVKKQTFLREALSEKEAEAAGISEKNYEESQGRQVA